MKTNISTNVRFTQPVNLEIYRHNNIHGAQMLALTAPALNSVMFLMTSDQNRNILPILGRVGITVTDHKDVIHTTDWDILNFVENAAVTVGPWHSTEPPVGRVVSPIMSAHLHDAIKLAVQCVGGAVLFGQSTPVRVTRCAVVVNLAMADRFMDVDTKIDYSRGGLEDLWHADQWARSGYVVRYPDIVERYITETLVAYMTMYNHAWQTDQTKCTTYSSWLDQHSKKIPPATTIGSPPDAFAVELLQSFFQGVRNGLDMKHCPKPRWTAAITYEEALRLMRVGDKNFIHCVWGDALVVVFRYGTHLVTLGVCRPLRGVGLRRLAPTWATDLGTDGAVLAHLQQQPAYTPPAGVVRAGLHDQAWYAGQNLGGIAGVGPDVIDIDVVLEGALANVDHIYLSDPAIELM